jgi:hypothetical protein
LSYRSKATVESRVEQNGEYGGDPARRKWKNHPSRKFFKLSVAKRIENPARPDGLPCPMALRRHPMRCHAEGA